VAEPTGVEGAVKVAEERIAALGMILDKRFVKIEKRAAEIEKKLVEVAAPKPAEGGGGSEALDALAERVTALESRPAEGGGGSEALDALAERVTTLESRPAEGGGSGALDELAERVSALESRKPGGGEGGGGPTEQDFDSLSDRILAMESRLESSSPGGGADTGALEARLVALEAKLDAVSWRAEGGLEARVVALEGKVSNGGGGGGAPGPAAGGDPGPSKDKLDALEKKIDVLLKLAAKVAALESQVELLVNAGPGERIEAPRPPTGRFKMGPAELKELTLDLTKTSEWKGLMDGQFRMMMKHLEGEVIPRVVKKHLEGK
jgi:hypothetical protein